jgi:ribosomal protein S17E
MTFNTVDFNANKKFVEKYLNNLTDTFRKRIANLQLNTDITFLVKSEMENFIKVSDESQAAARAFTAMKTAEAHALPGQEARMLEHLLENLLNELVAEGASSHAIGVALKVLHYFRFVS